MLYNAITGRKPFEIEKGREFRDIELLQAIRQGVFTPVQELRREVPVELAATVHKAISVDPESRFADLHAFGAALRPYASPQARLTWEAHFTSSAPVRRNPQMSIAIPCGAPPARASDNPANVDPTFPPSEATRGTAPTVVAKREATIALTTAELKAGSDEIHSATTARQPGHSDTGSLSLVIDEASRSQAAPPFRSTREIQATETRPPRQFRNVPVLIVGGAAVVFALVFGAALSVTHRKGPVAQVVSPPPELIAPAPPLAKVAATPPVVVQSVPPAVVAPPAPPPQAGPSVPLPTKHHAHKRLKAAVQLDQHGIAIPNE